MLANLISKVAVPLKFHGFFFKWNYTSFYKSSDAFLIRKKAIRYLDREIISTEDILTLIFMRLCLRSPCLLYTQLDEINIEVPFKLSIFRYNYNTFSWRINNCIEWCTKKYNKEFHSEEDKGHLRISKSPTPDLNWNKSDGHHKTFPLKQDKFYLKPLFE